MAETVEKYVGGIEGVDLKGLLQKVQNRLSDMKKESYKEKSISNRNRRFLHEDQIRVLNSFLVDDSEVPVDLRKGAMDYLFNVANFELDYCRNINSF